MSILVEKLPFGFDRRLLLTGASLFAAGLFTRGLFIARTKSQVTPSPQKTLLPNLSSEQLSKLPYPPDAFPGARDIDSPYGSIRAYEFGPDDGRKVLLIHGITTPCLALGAVAHRLADKGCRVMLFDLFGRGYSDNPGDLPQDLRLFTTEIMLVLTSSRLSWTGAGSGRFSMVGYSLGGGISAGFTSFFPELVDSLVLIAPAGLIRPHHLSGTSQIIYSEGVLPEPILSWFVRRRLQTPLYPAKKREGKEGKIGAANAATAEIALDSNTQATLSKSHPNITVESAVAHQIRYHEGFITAFVSSIRHGPITGQHTYWQRIGQSLSHRNGRGTAKVLVVSGEHDPVIIKPELVEDATSALDGNVEFRFVDAGHEAPVTKGNEVVDHIMKFWNE